MLTFPMFLVQLAVLIRHAKEKHKDALVAMRDFVIPAELINLALCLQLAREVALVRLALRQWLAF